MSWSKLVGHEQRQKQFQSAINRNRLASSFLFVGPPGIGKLTFARQLAQVLLCEGKSPADVDACGYCPACQQVIADTHPDLVQIARLPGKNKLLIEQFVGEKDKRGREGLCHDISLKPYRGGRKVAIVDDADLLTPESANSLLKTLEEPPPNSVLILVGTSEQKQLSTIRSRCQVIRFEPLDREQLRHVLVKENLIVDDDVVLDQIVDRAGGSIQRALQLADPDVFEFRRAWIEQLATLDPGAGQFSKIFSSFVDGAGKDASQKRDRLRLACEFAIDFYRDVLLALDNQDLACDNETKAFALSIKEDGRVDCQAIADCLDRCFEAINHVGANANAGTVIESLLIDLGRFSRGELASF
jgi:DNA polymerase-3 subunit delta'